MTYSYQRDREEFIARMTREGLPLHVTRLLLREATGINRRAELACSSEAADRDRVSCPATWTGRKAGPCLCDGNDAADGLTRFHAQITRITLQDWQAAERIHKALGEVNAANKPVPPATRVNPWIFRTDGDPRGYTLRVKPAEYRLDQPEEYRWIGVPAGPSGLRF